MLSVAILLVALVASAASVDNCPSGTAENCPSTSVAPNSVFDQTADWNKASSIYDFHANDIDGNNVSLEKYRNRVLIVVNVASKCGLTSTNYKQLEELYEKYGGENGTLSILAFPSNDFAGQEPGTSEQIKEFVKGYNVQFDMFEKVEVNGDDAHPLWKWLKSQKGGFLTDAIKWNFSKFLVDKNGHVVERYAPTTEPLSFEDELKKYF